MKRLVLGVLVLVAVVCLTAPVMAQERGAEERYPADVLERYYECMERSDLSQMAQMLEQHRLGRRIDASIYGLPKDDFDDRILLTIDERLWVREVKAAAGNALRTSGPQQYPHHMREFINHLYKTTGYRPDCSRILEEAGLPTGEAEVLQNGWTSDLNLTSGDSADRGEVDIAVDFANPARIIATSVAGGSETSNHRAVSTDWGATWSSGVVGNNSGIPWECDPVSYYQMNSGKIYHSKIGCSDGSCSSTYVNMRVSSNGGTTWADCGRPGASTSEDRQWHIIDNSPSSACYGNIYATWHNSNQEYVSRSTSSCSSWVNRTTLTSTGQAITPDINVAADGHVYVVWQNFGDSTFKIAGSSDCGATWTSPSAKTLKTRNGDWSNNLPAQCQRGVPTQPNVDVDRCPWSAYYGRVYVVLQDFNAACTSQAAYSCSSWDTNWSNTCNFDYFIMYSDNAGSSWSTPVNITSGDGNTVDNFLGYMRVDEKDGSIYLGYHRSRLSPAAAADRQKTNYFVKRSTNGGSTWETLQVSTQEGNERASGGSTFERGDYNGFAVYDGVVWPVWIDRRGGTGEEEIVTRKICTEPSHKSERAPSYTMAATTATPGASRVINVSWTLPDATWGDAGQSTASRKFQLYVDGTLAQDNISATTTSTTYTASDCTTSHSFQARAVNSCGVVKSYTAATATATGCGADFAISASPTSVSVVQGNSGTSTITTTVSGGFNNAIALSASGLPSGATATFNPTSIAAPGSGSSTLTLTAGASTPAGTYPITVTGTGGSTTHTTTVSFTVTATPTPDFTIAASPTAVSVVQGNTGTSTITTTVSGGFNSAIALSASGLPAGTTAALNPTSIAAPGAGTSTLTFTVGASTAIGTYTVTVTGTGGSKTHTATVSLTVTAPGPTTLLSDGFEGTGWSTAQVSGTAGSWTLAASGTHPAASPHGGTKLAVFNSYTSANGSQTRLYRSSGVSTSSYSTVTLSFWMYHDTGYSTYADKVQAQVSTNGTTWTNVGTAVNRYNGTTGWAQATIDLSAYAGQASVQVGFLGISAYGNDCYLDDVLVTATGGATPNFALSASPTSVSVVQGNSGTSTITSAISGGFNAAVALTASGVPTGTTATFSPTSIAAPGSGTSTLTLAVGSSTTTGTYTITVTGTGGGLTKTTTVSLTVTAAQTPNFALSASPTSLSVVQGNSGASTITSTISGGFNAAVALTASGVPTGTTATFSPTSIAAPGSGTSTLTLAVGASTATGTYAITVTGTGGGLTKTTSVSMTVTAAQTPNFALTASPTSLTVGQGANGTSTITSAISGGFNAAVALTASGVPTGTTATFSPTSIAAPGSGTSTLTLAVGASTTAGTYAITVTGTGGGLTRTTTVSLTVTGGCSSSTTAITSGQTLSGALATTDCTTTSGSGSGNAYYDYFTFSGTSGQSVTITENSTAFDAYLKLLNPSGTVVATNDDGNGGTNSKITYTLAATGTFKIVATTYYAIGGTNTITGAYTVSYTNSGGGGGTELVTNGGFETGTASPWVFATYSSITTGTPQAGTYKAQQLGRGTTTSTNFYQPIAGFNGATKTLTFYLKISSAEGTTTAYDYLYVRIKNTAGTTVSTLATYSNVNKTTYANWVLVTLTVPTSALANYRISFDATEDSSLQTTFFIDTVSIK